MKFTTAAAAVAIATLIGGGTATMVPSSATNQQARTTHQSPIITWISNRPCKQEDSVNCAWNAGERGNHHGHSFIVRQFPGKAKMICVMYDQRAFAKKHDYCESSR